MEQKSQAYQTTLEMLQEELRLQSQPQPSYNDTSTNHQKIILPQQQQQQQQLAHNHNQTAVVTTNTTMAPPPVSAIAFVQQQLIALRDQARNKKGSANDTTIDWLVDQIESLLVQVIIPINGTFPKAKAVEQQDVIREQEWVQAQPRDWQARWAATQEKLQKYEARLQEMNATVDKQTQQRMILEQQLATTQHAYETSVQDWQKNRSKLLEEIARANKNATKGESTNDDQRARQENIDQAVALAITEYQSMLDNLQTNLSQSNARIQHIQDSARRKENDLQQQLRSVSQRLEELQIQANHTLALEQEASRRVQEQLTNRIGELERELEKQQRARTVSSPAVTADELSPRRVQELEVELSAVKSNYSADLSKWEERSRAWQLERSNEQRAHRAFVARMESEAKTRIAAALAEAEQAKLALQESLQQSNQRYADQIKIIRDEAAKNETEWRHKLQSIETKLQDYQLKAQKTLLEEKEAAATQQQQLQTEIDAKSNELEELTKLVEQQRLKTDELLQRNLYLELTACQPSKISNATGPFTAAGAMADDFISSICNFVTSSMNSLDV